MSAIRFDISSEQASAALSGAVRWLLEHAKPDWWRSAVSLGRQLALNANRQLCGIPYEVLEYESILELKDGDGQASVYRKRERIRFRVGGLAAFRDELWGTGNLASSYRCQPGKLVDLYQDGAKRYALISLREEKQVGDVVEFNIQRTVRDGFGQEYEWREVEINHPTRKLELSIIFPRDRKCLSAWVHEKRARKTTPLSSGHFSTLADGRQILTWRSSAPQLHELYTLRWRW